MHLPILIKHKKGKPELVLGIVSAVIVVITALFQQYGALTPQANKNDQQNEYPQFVTFGPALDAAPSATSTATVVTRVIDGDTVEINGGIKVRYIGIDTPELSDPRSGIVCFGQEAKQKNKELVEGQQVVLVRDISDTDQFGRLLRYVYKGDTFINDVLVREGYGRASRYPPDVRYAEMFREAEREAREQKRGLWGSPCNRM